MKRRKLIEYGTLGSAAFFTQFLFRQRLTPARINRKQHYNWVFLYWMPYDNDLSRFGKPIIEMIARGVRSDNLLITVQADFWRSTQLSRSIITQDKTETQDLPTTNSASVEVFADYLHWAQSRFRADRWAIIFLGHGGRLDELSPDDHRGKNSQERQWMNIRDIAETVQRFNAQIGKPLELFFFQNCNKGTLEAHYTMREIAKYTLSSQELLGAPNYYYESLFQFLGHSPGIDGSLLARKIREFEGSDMYLGYTIADNHKFSNIAATLNPLIELIVSAKGREIDLNSIPRYRYAGENYVDIVVFLRKVVQKLDVGHRQFEDFVRFLRNSLIYLPNTDFLEIPTVEEEVRSGLGVLLPANREQLERYRYLRVYSDIKLTELFEIIL